MQHTNVTDAPKLSKGASGTEKLAGGGGFQVEGFAEAQLP